MATDTALLLNKPNAHAGLIKYTFHTPSAGPYNVTIQFTENNPSAVYVQVNQNGLTRYLSPIPRAHQIAYQFKVDMNCAQNDQITVDITTAGLAIDHELNTVKSVTTIGDGY